MGDLQKQLAEAEAHAARLRQQIAHATCKEIGCCDWQFSGGANAGCELGDDCTCSQSVNQCSRCGDCDYGQNAERDEVLADCRKRAEYLSEVSADGPRDDHQIGSGG